LLVVLLLMVVTAASPFGFGGGDSGGAGSAGDYTAPGDYTGNLSEPPADADTEFWVTRYDPAKGGINGKDCGGAAADIGLVSNTKSTCLTADERNLFAESPTGYVTKKDGVILDTAAIAVPQVNDGVPVPLIHNKVAEQARILIPGYNANNPAIVADHFASTVTKKNRLDLVCTATKWQDVANYWNKYKLALDSAAGLNGGTKIMSKIVGTVIRN